MKDLRATNKPKRETLTLVACLLLAMVLLAVVTQLLLGGLGFLFGAVDSVLEPFLPATLAIVLLWAAMVVGAWLRWAEVQSGGAVVARRLGAVQASNRSRNSTEKSLRHVVSAMAIASGCKRPSVFVLRDELSINSLTVGSLSGDIALVVTQGALDELTRDELASVVAHECAHIAQGDIPTHMKKMIALAGLLALDQMGQRLAEKGRGKTILHPINLVGKLFSALGVVGGGIAGLLPKFSSNQNEFNADAKAIHTARQARPLTSVFTKIKQSDSCRVALHAYYSDEIKHLCFHTGNKASTPVFLDTSQALLDARMNAIDPDASAAKTSPDELIVPSSKVDSAVREAMAKIAPDQIDSANASIAANSAPLSREVKDAKLSERGVFMMPNIESCLAALFALFLPKEESARKHYLSSVAFAYNQKFSTLVGTLAQDMSQELTVERLGVMDYATRRISKNLKSAVHKPMLLNLERLLKAQGLFDLMNYAALQHIRSRLSADFPILKKTPGDTTPDAEQRLLKPVEKMGEELALLISLVLESTTLNRREIDDEYSRFLDRYTDTNHPRRTEKESGIVGEVEAAFQLMLMQPTEVRESFVQQCKHINELDRSDTGEQRSLMQVFSASLGYPMAIDNLVTEPLLSHSA